jgi:hypothetical protein
MARMGAGLDLDSIENRRKTVQFLEVAFRKLLRTCASPQVFFEVGAFSAEFSRSIHGAFPDTDFHAFEANPYNYRKFRELVEASSPDISPGLR